MNLVDLDKKKIIVFGASSGIGKATSVLLSKLGAQVVLVARREKFLQETAEEMEDFRGGGVLSIQSIRLICPGQINWRISAKKS